MKDPKTQLTLPKSYSILLFYEFFQWTREHTHPIYFTSTSSSKTEPSKKAEQFFYRFQFKRLLKSRRLKISKQLNVQQQDNMEIAALYWFQGKTQYYFDDYLKYPVKF